VPPAPEHDPVSWRFRSRRVPDEDVAFTLWRPDGPSANAALPVLVARPGRGSSARVAFDNLHLHAFLAPELARTGVLAGLASVDGGESHWHARRRRRPDGDARDGVPAAPRAGVRARRGGQRDRRLVDGRLRRPLLAAECDPARWSGVAVASPAIWPDYGDVWVGDAFDSRADFERNDVFAGAARLKRMPVWIGCGTSDPFHANARGLAAALRGARTDWAEGGHDQCLWRLVAPVEMAVVVGAFRA
jgi:hypothetical protein